MCCAPQLILEVRDTSRLTGSAARALAENLMATSWLAETARNIGHLSMRDIETDCASNCDIMGNYVGIRDPRDRRDNRDPMHTQNPILHLHQHQKPNSAPNNAILEWHPDNMSHLYFPPICWRAVNHSIASTGMCLDPRHRVAGVLVLCTFALRALAAHV